MDAVFSHKIYELSGLLIGQNSLPLVIEARWEPEPDCRSKLSLVESLIRCKSQTPTRKSNAEFRHEWRVPFTVRTVPMVQN